MIPASRIGLALGASVALHGTALAVLHGLPVGLGDGATAATPPAEPLQVRVRSVPGPYRAATMPPSAVRIHILEMKFGMARCRFPGQHCTS